MMVEKFRNSKLQGVVPKDAAKWGIKTGSAEEWAALSVAVAQQESSFNPYAPNGGLNQFNADDLARYGLRGRAVTDVDAQGQALVNQWAGSIPKDNVIAGAGPDGKWGGATRYFGSMRRRGEADKYLQWAQGVRDQAERQKQAQDVVGRGEGEVMSAPKKGLPAYMLDDAIKKDGASMEEKLHINVKVRTPKAGYSIRTNSDGESIGSIMTRREFKPETADNGK